MARRIIEKEVIKLTLQPWNKIKAQIRASPERIYELIRKEGGGGGGGSVNITGTQLTLAIPVTVATGTNTGETGSLTAQFESMGITNFNLNVIGIVPAGNQDQFVSKVEVLPDDNIKVTLAANATAANIFAVGVVVGITEG